MRPTGVAYEDRIAMEETLEASIARIVEADVTPTAEPPPAGPAKQPGKESPALSATADLIRRAGEACDRAVQAQREGDWVKCGEELKKLGAILNELQKSQK